MNGSELTVGSLFSGVEGFGLGFRLAGWTVRWTSEIDRHASSVIKQRFPDAPNMGDITKADAAALGGVDCITFGFPCQDLSVAGYRAGLDGARSGLFWEALVIIAAKRPRWIVAENVPGLQSSNQGMDFGVVLWALAALGYGLAYAELDARYYGVPQRRRRLFIVGCLGDAARARQVLADARGGYRNPTPSQETGRLPADGAGDGTARPLYYSHDYSQDRIYDGEGGAVPAITVDNRTSGHFAVSHTPRSNPYNNSDPRSHPFVRGALTTREGKGADGNGRGNDAAPRIVSFDTQQDPVSGTISGCVGANTRQAGCGPAPSQVHAARDGTPAGIPRWLDLPMWQGPAEPWRVHLDAIATGLDRSEEGGEAGDPAERGTVGRGRGALAGQPASRERESEGRSPRARRRPAGAQL